MAARQAMYEDGKHSIEQTPYAQDLQSFGMLCRSRSAWYVARVRCLRRAHAQAALRCINKALGAGISAEEATAFRNGLQFPAIMNQPAITDLFNRSNARTVSPHTRRRLTLRPWRI